MNQVDQSSVTKQRSRKLKPVAVTTVALIAVGALGFALGQDMRFAFAEPAQTAPTAQTSLGAAPLSFADIAQKVTPAVVSISVKGDFEVSENDLNIPGLPDLPEDSPLLMISSSSSRSGSARVSSTARGALRTRI